MSFRRSSFAAAAVSICVLLLGTTLLGGCSILDWPSEDYVGVTGSLDGATGSDSATAVDGAMADGPLDAPVEGAVDAGGPTCDGAIFCDDFERASLTGPFGTSDGLVAISTDHAHSPTRALSATASNGHDSPQLSAQLDVPSRVTLSFWFYTPTVPPGAGTNFRLVQVLWGGSCDWDLAWDIHLNADNGLSMGVATYDATKVSSCGPLAQQSQSLLDPSTLFSAKWHHVVATMDVSSSKRSATAMVDDGVQPPVTVVSVRTDVPTTAALAVGIPCIQTSSGCFPWTGADYQVWVDDVVLTATP